MVLTKGANAPLPAGAVAIEVTAAASSPGVDVSALLLADDGKVRGDADLVFYNQPTGAGGAVRLSRTGRGHEIALDLERLPASVVRVVVAASADDEAAPGASLGDVHGLQARVTAGAAEHTFAPAMESGERAAVLVEVYRRGDGWKVRAIGQGWASGLAGLATGFGVELDEGPVPAPPEPPARPPVSLGKVVLEKAGSATISLDKADRSLVVVASIEWDGGSRRRRSLGADLDLYALYVPRSELGPRRERVVDDDFDPFWDEGGDIGAGGAVYYRHLGSLTEPPFIEHAGDSQAPGIETIRIKRPDLQGYVLICAYSALSNGEGSFRSFGAKAVVSDGRGSRVEAPLFHTSSNAYWVAIALIDFTHADGVQIRHVETYSSAHEERRPTLYADGTFAMDTGPMEFKDDD
ncbi:Tellurium resistance protein [Motilibacter sp. K478]|nr:Tellurium resistance protein [Motilibacter aurantiacus]